MTAVRIPRAIRFGALSAVLAVVVGGLASMVTTVGAQEDGETYSPDVGGGELVIEGTDELGPGVEVTLSGDGFDPGSPVEAQIFSSSNGVFIVRESFSADADGNAVFTTALPDRIIEGAYTAALLGIAPDDAFMSLTAEVFIIGNVDSLATTTTSPPPTTDAATRTTDPAVTSTTAAGSSESGTDDASSGDASTDDASTGDGTTPTVPGATADDGGDSGDAASESAADAVTSSPGEGGGSTAVAIIIGVVVAALVGTGLVIRRQSLRVHR